MEKDEGRKEERGEEEGEKGEQEEEKGRIRVRRSGLRVANGRRGYGAFHYRCLRGLRALPPRHFAVITTPSAPPPLPLPLPLLLSFSLLTLSSWVMEPVICARVRKSCALAARFMTSFSEEITPRLSFTDFGGTLVSLGNSLLQIQMRI